MGIADGMKSITEDILNSYDDRVKVLTDLVTDTQRLVASARKTLKGFASDRKKMSSEQAENLSNFVKDLVKNVGGLIKELSAKHKEMSEKQAKGLAEFVETLNKDVTSLLNDFEKQHKEMSTQLKGKLAKEKKVMQTQVKAFLGECQRDMQNAKSAWQGMETTLAKAKRKGIMAKIEAGEKVVSVEEAVQEKSKKKATKKNKK